uniref:IST1-like protein n=1 Tax=Kalanchoe fedtschenkoi TaxID=63787 RepID=A0A7N1A3M0_KALFE
MYCMQPLSPTTPSLLFQNHPNLSISQYQLRLQQEIIYYTTLLPDEDGESSPPLATLLAPLYLIFSIRCFFISLHLSLHFTHPPNILHSSSISQKSLIIMFGFLFGWRKASKCKRLMMRIQCRLKLIISKRIAIVRQVRDDVAQLLKAGHPHHQTIFTRVEQLYMDEIIITVYELLGHFSEFITINLPYISRHKDCPNDVNEAISSLIFASARCGDVPELTTSRELFEERYGRRFVRTALHLLPGNLVNSQIKEKLSITSVSDEAKLRLVNEIFRDYCLQPGSLAIQYNQEWHQKQQANEEHMEIQDVKEVPREAMEFTSASNTQSEDCFSLQANDLTYTIRNHPATVLPAQNSVLHQKVSEMEESANISRMPSLSSCSDISVHIPDENLIYLDDIEELRSPKLYDCSSPDKTVFVFKSSPLVIVGSGHNDHPSVTRRRLRNSFVSRSRKLRKRPSSSSRESVNYCKDSFQELKTVKAKPLRQENHQRKVMEDVTGPVPAKWGVFQSQVSNDLSLCAILQRHSRPGSPSYGHVKEGTAKVGTRCFHEHHDQKRYAHRGYQPDLTADQASGLIKPSGVMEKTTIYEDNICSLESSTGSNALESPPLNKNVALTFYVKDAETRYLRAFTMPTEQRPKDHPHDKYSRTSSLPVPSHVNHVHPKLPDYNQIEAKFSALKQDYLHRIHA